MPFNKEINIFECREVVESIFEGVVEPYTHLKIADSNRSNHSSKIRGRDALSKPTPMWPLLAGARQGVYKPGAETNHQHV